LASAAANAVASKEGAPALAATHVRWRQPAGPRGAGRLRLPAAVV